MTPLHLTLWNQGPYGLKFTDEDDDIYDMMSVSINEVILLNENGITRLDYSDPDLDINIKPILRRLSDLDKEITHNGERFVPMERLVELNPEMDSIEIGIHSNDIILYEPTENGAIAVSMRFYDQLNIWHFNTRNLPDSDFIPVTNEFNPYK